MASAFSNGSQGQLKRFFEKNLLPDGLIEYLVDTVKLQAISDYASLFTETDYEEECTKLAAKVPALKDDLIAVSRLRTAWRLAPTELTRACESRGAMASEEDWDAPLQDDVEAERSDQFRASYPGISFDTESTPTAASIGRFYREFRKKKISVYPLHKVKSEAEARQPLTTKRRKLADNISIVVDDETPHSPICTVTEVLWRLKLLTNGWALAGVDLVDPPPPAAALAPKVRMCHLQDAAAYFDFILRKVCEHPGPEHMTVSWVLDRDRQTRGRARAMVIEGWPWGPALQAACSTHCLVLWNLGVAGMPDRQQIAGKPAEDVDSDAPTPPFPPPRAKSKAAPKRTAKLTKSWKANVCRPFNTKKGCYGRCRNGKEHRCIKCGGWDHAQPKCPN